MTHPIPFENVSSFIESSAFLSFSTVRIFHFFEERNDLHGTYILVSINILNNFELRSAVLTVGPYSSPQYRDSFSPKEIKKRSNETVNGWQTPFYDDLRGRHRAKRSVERNSRVTLHGRIRLRLCSLKAIQGAHSDNQNNLREGVVLTRRDTRGSSPSWTRNEISLWQQHFRGRSDEESKLHVAFFLLQKLKTRHPIHGLMWRTTDAQ